MRGLGFAFALVFGLSVFMTSEAAEAQADPFVGQISWVGFNFAPRGWAFCDGQILQVSEHSALFSLLGTTYGGDGRTTFALPDMRGRSPVHAGSGPGLSRIVLGQKGGHEDSLERHDHGVPVTGSIADQKTPVGNVPAAKTRSSNYNAMGSGDEWKTTMEGDAGTNLNRSPYLGVHCIIALVGTYPSRN